jgi:hypothetical protein
MTEKYLQSRYLLQNSVTPWQNTEELVNFQRLDMKKDLQGQHEGISNEYGRKFDNLHQDCLRVFSPLIEEPHGHDTFNGAAAP